MAYQLDVFVFSRWFLVWVKALAVVVLGHGVDGAYDAAFVDCTVRRIVLGLSSWDDVGDHRADGEVVVRHVDGEEKDHWPCVAYSNDDHVHRIGMTICELGCNFIRHEGKLLMLRKLRFCKYTNSFCFYVNSATLKKSFVKVFSLLMMIQSSYL